MDQGSATVALHWNGAFHRAAGRLFFRILKIRLFVWGFAGSARIPMNNVTEPDKNKMKTKKRRCEGATKQINKSNTSRLSGIWKCFAPCSGMFAKGNPSELLLFARYVASLFKFIQHHGIIWIKMFFFSFVSFSYSPCLMLRSSLVASPCRWLCVHGCECCLPLVCNRVKRTKGAMIIYIPIVSYKVV